MVRRKIFTVDDLYSFLVAQNMAVKFSAEASGNLLCVASEGKATFVEENDSEGLLFVKVKAFHDLSNRNRSYIDTEKFKERLSTMKDRPIMADIVEVADKNGNIVKDFSGHTIEINEETGGYTYVEKPVGHFIKPEDFRAEYDKEYERTFAVADAVIYEEYSDACDILRRRGEVDCSVELVIRDMAYDPKEKVMVFNDYYVQGCTLLGEAVAPGMAGSKVTLADFSVADVENNEKGGDVGVMDDKMNNDVTEVQEAEPEVVEAEAEATETVEEEAEEPEVTEEESAEEPEVSEEESEVSVEEPEGTESESTEEPEAVANESEEKFTKTFELSHDDIRCALYNLLIPYEDADNEWYWISDVYDSHFVYEGFFNEKVYGQNYTKDDDLVAFDGERYNLHKELLTDAEYAQLQEMRSNYAVISEKLAKYEQAEDLADKMTVFEDPSYGQFLETKEFKAIQTEEFLKGHTKEEISDRADIEFSKLIKKSGKFELKAEAKEEAEKPKKGMFFGFAQHETNNSFLDGLLKA